MRRECVFGTVTSSLSVLLPLTRGQWRPLRLGFGQQIAPIQISWAGYVGTMDLIEMDFVLGDIYPRSFLAKRGFTIDQGVCCKFLIAMSSCRV